MNAKHLRRIASLALVCVLLFGGSVPFCSAVIPTLTVQAATSDSGFQYTADSAKKTTQITGFNGSALSVKIPSELGGYPVTSIKAEAFKNHGSLLSVTIPDTVSLIGSEAFANCLLLSTVKLGSGLATIGTKAFSNCPMITSIALPAATSSIGSQAFFGCKALSEITVASGNLVYAIKEGALTDRLGTTLFFYPPARSDKKYTVPNVVTIDDYAFANAKNLTSVLVPESVINLGKGVFSNCTALEQVSLSSKLKKIDDEMFIGCTKLNSVSFPDSVTSIGKSAFKNCTAIPALTVPDTVTSLGESAFSGCTGIKWIMIGKGLKNLTADVFSGCTNVAEYKVADGANYSVQEGVLYSKDGTELIAYPPASKAASYVVGDKVTKIGTNAFDSCKNLKKLTIPKNVKSFGQPVIKNCSGLTVYVESGSEAEKHFKFNTEGNGELKIGSEKPGDINNSGTVDNADVILLRRYVAGWKNVTVQTDAADVNKDSKVDNADVILLRRYVAGWKNVTLK